MTVERGFKFLADLKGISDFFADLMIGLNLTSIYKRLNFIYIRHSIFG